MFSTRLAERLLVAVAAGLGGCASSDGEVAIPATSSTAAVSAVPPSGTLAMPVKDPRESMWHADGAACMPAWATRKPAVAGACGSQPDAWYFQGPHCRYCVLDFSEAISRAERAKHGGDACCYQEAEPVPLGRPLRGPLGPLVASAPSGIGAWVRDALLEHASVASFARLALELLSMGAPSELVRGAHEAALDELRHADVCFALAGERAPRLGALPVGRALPLARDRVELALRSIEEGCIGEAFAACEAFEVAARSDDARVTAALSAIARDEARHAELAARVAAWALRTAIPAERQRIAAGVDELRGKAAPHFEGAEGGEGGRLGRVARADLWAAVQRDVVQPTLRALVSEDRLSTYG